MTVTLKHDTMMWEMTQQIRDIIIGFKAEPLGRLIHRLAGVKIHHIVDKDTFHMDHPVLAANTVNAFLHRVRTFEEWTVLREDCPTGGALPLSCPLVRSESLVACVPWAVRCVE